MKCPNCGEECNRDEVDVGVGVISGPWSCYECGWSEDIDYNKSDGPSIAEQRLPNHYVDPCGGMTSHRTIAKQLDHFGLGGDRIIEEVFCESE